MDVQLGVRLSAARFDDARTAPCAILVLSAIEVDIGLYGSSIYAKRKSAGQKEPSLFVSLEMSWGGGGGASGMEDGRT